MTQRHIFVSRNAEWEKTAQKDFFLPESPLVLDVENALLLPPRPRQDAKPDQAPWVGGVINSNGACLAGNYHYLPCEKRYDWGDCAGAYFISKNQIENADESVIFGGILQGQFGHFLTESMARFWYFFKNHTDTRRIVLMKGEGWLGGFSGGGSLLNRPQWFEDFTRLLKILPERFLWIERPTRFRHVTIPTESIHSFSGFRTEFRNYCQQLAQNACEECAGEPTFEKIFLNYSKSKGNAQLINEPLFEEFFSRFGFQSISPERFSIARQIHLLANAREIAGTIGTATHLAMFSKPNTPFYGLLRSREFVVVPQIIVNQIAQLNAFITDTTHNFLPSVPVHGVKNLIFTDDFRQFSAQVFGAESLQICDELAQKINDAHYLKAWAEHFQNPVFFKFHNLHNTNGFDFLNLLSEHFCEKTLNKAIFPQSDFKIISRAEKVGNWVLFPLRKLRALVWKIEANPKGKTLLKPARFLWNCFYKTTRAGYRFLKK